MKAATGQGGRGRRVRAPGGRDAVLLLIARVVMSGQRAFIGVVVPIYLARRGFSAAQLGLLFSVVAMTAAVMSTAIGIGADRLGARGFLIWVPMLTAASAIVFALSDQPAAMYIAAAVGSFGRGSGAGGGQVGPYQPPSSHCSRALSMTRAGPRSSVSSPPRVPPVDCSVRCSRSRL